jgi:hypothetical protein
VSVAPARAEVALDYYLPAGTPYDAKVPTPQQHFGFQVGEWHLRSDQIVSYLRAVADAAPQRVKFEVLGYTHERKPLILLTITSPANHARLEEIREQHLALTAASGSNSGDVTRMPVVVDMGYSIHGNEPSGVNAMPLVVYHLAAAQDPRVEQMLENAIVLVEAYRNPDGGDRAAQWFNQHKSINALSSDPADREHNEAWPRGRFNHYWFDPNRDWLPLVHPEALARAELFHRWRPNVLTDHHEMGTNTTFFFQPGVRTRNNPSIPSRVIELTHKIAAYHQRALDGRGIFYYSEQGFDDFYPGKGSTYPDLHGTVGILYEQASSRGHAQDSINGLLTFPFTIRNQVITSFSTLEAAIALRTDLLTLQRDFSRVTAQLAEKSKVRAYVFGDDGDPARAWALLDLFAKHRIQVRPLDADISAEGHEFKRGHAWVVPTDQPQHRLITEMFVRRTKFEDNVFYDVSAWTLPLAFNLPFAELDKLPAAGAVAPVPPFPSGKLVGAHNDYAYLIDWRGYYAPRALRRLQQAGIKVKGLTGTEVEVAVSDGTRATLKPGAILVPVGMQVAKAAKIREVIDQVVREDAVVVYGVTTGLTPRGNDLGSASFVPLELPRVALIVGQGVDPQEAGAAWHVLDQRVGIAPTLLDVAQASRVDLWRFNAIVMVDGTYDDLSESTVTSLKRWIRDGGTLVTIGKAMQWAAKKEIAALEFGDARAQRSGEPKGAWRIPYAQGQDTEALKLVSGAVFAASIDVTHPLGFGFNGDRLSLCRANTIILRPSKSPYETPAVYTANPLQSGYASEANQRQIAESAAAVALPIGRGVVIALPDDPNFRGFWYGGNRLFFNALFFGSAIEAVRSGEGEAAELTPLGGDEPHSH